MPHPSEVREVHESDVPRIVVDRPAIRDPFDKDSPDRYGDPLARFDGTRIPCFNGPPQGSGVFRECRFLS